MVYSKLSILSLEITSLDYSDILESIVNAKNEAKLIIITGANANTVNIALDNLKFAKILNKFNIVHPDGIGIFLTSRFLFGKDGLKNRITGSDLYPRLIQLALKNYWSFYFFGDTDETHRKIPLNYPGLRIVGSCNGFIYNNDSLISDINKSCPDFLIVGLGSPKQEEWIIDNMEKVNTKIIIAVGEGIKVFAGTKKRGPKFVQMIGFEWLVRLLTEPKRLWKRYLIGIPLFIFRVLIWKIKLVIKRT